MNLESLIRAIGYAGVIAIIFAENGLLIGFFLPGDSLLFTAGFLASQHFFSIVPLTILLFLASVVGTQVGYFFGFLYGPRVFNRPNSRFFKKENADKAQAFYEKHGTKTIVLARFVPVVRTFAPIVAGIAKMDWKKFLTFNVIGGAIWAAGLTLAGYWLGTKVTNVDRYLLPIIALIILLSILPGILHMLKTPERRHGVWQSIVGIVRRTPRA
ncbi:MAG: DedA family protein [Candidatus Kerfeldbacteria bacterium]